MGWKWMLLVPAMYVTLSLQAQDSTALNGTKPQRDSGWIERFDNQMLIKLAAINTSESLTAQASNFKNVLKPNPSEILRLYVNYRFISFYINHIPRFLPGNNDNTEKGKTKGIGFGTTLNFRSWFTEAYYSHNRGYYLYNTNDYRPNWQPGDPYVQVPDLTVNSFSGAIGYNTNPRLSLPATTTQTERQLKSAGAFIPRLSYRYHVINSPGNSFSQKSRNFQALLGAGYQHSFVARKRFYVTGSFTPSFGYIFYRLYTQNGPDYTVSNVQGPIYQWDGLLGFGYNGSRFFAGTYLTATAATYAQGLTSAVNQDAHLFLQLFAGIRFKAPKFLSKNYDKIFH